MAQPVNADAVAEYRMALWDILTDDESNDVTFQTLIDRYTLMEYYRNEPNRDRLVEIVLHFIKTAQKYKNSIELNRAAIMFELTEILTAEELDNGCVEIQLQIYISKFFGNVDKKPMFQLVKRLAKAQLEKTATVEQFENVLNEKLGFGI
jgi:hypothetical protein